MLSTGHRDRSSKTVPREVVATIIGSGQKHLVRITVDTDGQAGNETGSMVATAGHPFRIGQYWVEADDVQPGDELNTPKGGSVEVVAIREYTDTRTVYNLTINQHHTYSVTTGQAAVVTHNCNNDQGVYAFMHKQDGKLYVGKSSNLTARLRRHARKGRRDSDGHVTCVHVCGGDVELENAEADLIQHLGGTGNLANKINSPGLRRITK